MIQNIPEIPDEDAARIVKRHDGFYWIDPDTGMEFGPFTTAEQAWADMQAGGESDYESGESLEEAEAELGISDWIDAETGELAEDSIPRLDD